MTLRINFNLGSVFAHQNLRDVDRLMEKTLDHLSSGIRIRRAGDDPAGMVLANNLRHHLKGVEKATQNSEEGISMVQTAEGAMDEVSNLLLRIRTLTVQAANAGAQNPASLAAIQAEFDSAISSITRTATDTRFGSLPLLQGQLADNTVNVADRDVLKTVLHDATKLPGGIQPGSALTTTVAAPTTLARSAVTVTLTVGDVFVPDLDAAVLITLPASRSACVTAYEPEQLSVPPGAKPPTGSAAHVTLGILLSAIVIADFSVVLPELVTM